MFIDHQFAALDGIETLPHHPKALRKDGKGVGYQNVAMLNEQMVTVNVKSHGCLLLVGQSGIIGSVIYTAVINEEPIKLLTEGLSLLFQVQPESIFVNDFSVGLLSGCDEHDFLLVVKANQDPRKMDIEILA